jgi:hypothetical protein
MLYDAFGKPSQMQKDWGFSALVEYGGKRILFDTGNNSEVLAHNVKAKGIDLKTAVKHDPLPCVQPSPKQEKLGGELRKAGGQCAGKKVVEMPGGHAGAGLQESGAREHLRPLAAVI